MTTFRFRGRDRAGHLVNGELAAESASAVAAQLAQSGVTPVRIDPAAERGAALKLFEPRPGLTELMLFARQMHALTKAGIPLVRALRSLADSTHNPRLAAALRAVVESLSAGRDLAGSLAQHPEIFPPLFVSVVRVGENSGRLDEAFKRLHQYLSFDRLTREQVRSALRYPIVVLTAVAAAIAVMMSLVVPKFATIFKSFGGQLPLPTRVIMAVSDFTLAWWWLLLGLAVAAAVAVRAALRTGPGALWWDRRKLALPIVGAIVRRACLARFARAFAMTLRSGVPLLDSFALVARAVQNEFIAAHIRGMREAVERGEALSRAAAAAGLFTPLTLQMLAVGEETGRVEEMLDEVADFYDQDVRRDVESLGTLIEPLLIVLVGGVVLVLALGVFLPMWDLAGVALRRG